MLELRPNCECCNKDLLPDSKEAFICSFECTFCQNCTETILNFICPNCNGDLVSRPTRPFNGVYSLQNYPASTKRVYNPGNCVSAK